MTATRTVPWRRALVTGASSGIGEAIARRLAGDGVAVVVVGRDAGRTEAVASELAGSEAIVADLAVEDGVRAVEHRLAVEGGSAVDLLVNCAGFAITEPFVGPSSHRHQETVAVNVTALMRLCHVAARHMTAGGGILNISSTSGFGPVPGAAVYAAAKAFVTTFSRALGQELQGREIVVACVCPGYTRTRFLERAQMDAAVVEDDRWQSADEVAEVAIGALLDADPGVVLTSERNAELAAQAADRVRAAHSVRLPSNFAEQPSSS